MATGAAVPWETCAEEDCVGVRLGAGRACLIHTPAEVVALGLTYTGRGVDLDARGVRFTRESIEPVMAVVPTDETGRHLLGRVRLDQATFDSALTFDEASFTGEVSMNGTVFKHGARFGGAVFAAPADFGGATFGGQAWFLGTTFGGPVSFRGTTFTGPAWFKQAIFAGPAGFEGAVFSADATLTGARFSSVAAFSGASFQGHARFDQATSVGGWHFDGARFLLQGEAPPEARQSAVPQVPPPPATSFDRPVPAARQRPTRARPDGVNLLIPLVALVILVAAGYIVLRPG